MFLALNVRLTFLSKQTIFSFEHFSTWALVQFPDSLLLAVFLPVFMEMIPKRSAPRMMGMDTIGLRFSETFSFPLQIYQRLQ